MQSREDGRKERIVNLALEAIFFHFLFFPQIGFKLWDMTFHLGVNGHQINRESGSYLHCAIVPGFAIATLYPSGTVKEVSLSVPDLY